MSINFPKILILLGIVVYSQNSNAQDSFDVQFSALLEKVAANKRQPDTLANVGSKLIALSKTHGQDIALLKGYYYKGLSHYLRGDFETTLKYYDSALVDTPKALKLDNPFTIKLLRNRAITYARSGKSAIAKKEFERALQLSLQSENYTLAANTYSDLGIGEKNADNYEGAIVLYTKAMRIWDSLDLEKRKTPVLLNIGIAQGGLGDYQQSNKSFYEVIRISKKYQIARDEYRAYNNLSVNFKSLNQHDSARFYIKKLIPRYKARGMMRDLHIACQNLGEIYLKEEKMDSSLFYLSKSLVGFQEINDPNKEAESLYNLAKLHFFKKENATAIALTKKSIAISKEMEFNGLLKQNYSVLASLYEAEGNYKEANTYLKYIKDMEDKLSAVENAKNLNELLTKHQVKEKDATISLLSKSKAFFKSTSFIIAIVSLVLLAILLFVIKRNLNSKKALKELREQFESYRSQKEKATSTLLHLKSKAVIKVNQLLYVKSDGHYLEFYSDQQTKPEIDRQTLKELSERLTPEGFAQIHKSYLVNLKCIRIINSTKIMLDNGVWLPLSRTYKPKLKELLLDKEEE